MEMKHVVKNIALAALLATTAVMAQTPYDEGQKALRDKNWMEAADHFEQAIEADNSQADAAMYWRAYAYYKAGRKNEAERELRGLERKYPQSNWVKEAQALRIEHQDTAESVAQVTSGGSGLDEELRLFALAQLMDRDPERALPLVLDLVQNSESQSVRQDALFVLVMSEEPAARQALGEVARNNSDPELQRTAIHMLGTMEATSELESIYATLQDREARVAVIEAFSIAGDSEKLKQVLATETDPELRKAAIYGIAMEDSNESADIMESIYETTASTEEKLAILEALTMMDQATELALKILRTETDPELQRQAIHVLGIMEATEELGDLYGNVNDRDSRLAILEAMAISEDSDGLFKILQVEQDAELRSAAIQSLAISDGEDAADYLVKLYPDGSREEKTAVIHSMMIMDNTEGLLSLLKQENDPELKREMLQMLTTMDSEESDEYLFELLEKSG
jgi:outer membrane protein assembly factor BamD (BamD/ComL family)